MKEITVYLVTNLNELEKYRRISFDNPVMRLVDNEITLSFPKWKRGGQLKPIKLLNGTMLSRVAPFRATIKR